MKRACEALGLPRATAYRRLQPPMVTCAPPPRPSHRRIPDNERDAILAVLDSERFIDQPPREVYGALLSEGTYLCAWRTMYRVLAERGPVRERRNQREPRHHAIPRLTASAPNAVWSWDISKLATYERGVFLNLYVVLDLFSRFVVAWMVAKHENSALAKQLFRELAQLIGDELSCEVALEGTGVQEQYRCEGIVSVTFGSETIELPCDDDNGWKLLDPTHIEIQGDMCTRFKESLDASISASFPCEYLAK